MGIVKRHSTECPYCLSQVTLTTYDDGRFEIRHHEPFGPECESGLWRLTSEGAKANGFRGALRRN